MTCFLAPETDGEPNESGSNEGQLSRVGPADWITSRLRLQLIARVIRTQMVSNAGPQQLEPHEFDFQIGIVARESRSLPPENWREDCSRS